MTLFFSKFKASKSSLIFVKKFLILINENGSLLFYKTFDFFSPKFYLGLNKSGFFTLVFMFDNSLNTTKYFFINYSIKLLNKLRIFISGNKKYIVIKGLGFKLDFCSVKSSNIINVKIGYSHRIFIKVPLNVFFKIVKNNNVLLQNKNIIYLNFLINLLFRLRKHNVYKQKGFFNANGIFISKINKKKN
jgi:ribosomal protein L6P/L9E